MRVNQIEEKVEWDEPRCSPENHEFFVPYAQFLRLMYPHLSGTMSLTAALSLVVFITLTAAGFSRLLHLALILAGFVVVVGVMFTLVAHNAYLFLCCRVRRRVRIDAEGIGWTMGFIRGRQFSFASVEGVTVEPLDNGAHRLIVLGPKGELCRLRLPVGIDAEAIEWLVPAGKLTRQSGIT